MKQTRFSSNKSIAVDAVVDSELTQKCKEWGITKKDFISLSLKYFTTYGINPKANSDADTGIARCVRRISDSISIMRRIERDVLIPMAAKVEDTLNQARTNSGDLGILIHS